MLACTADSRLKARRVDTELVDGVGSRELAECINGSPMSIASSAAAGAVAGPSPLLLGPFLCARGGGDLGRITGTSTTSSSSSELSAEEREETPEEETIWSLIAVERTCRMVEDEDEEEPEGRGPDDGPASGLAFPPPDFLFLTKMGFGGPGCWTTTFPLSLFVCAAVDAPRAFFDRVL